MQLRVFTWDRSNSWGTTSWYAPCSAWQATFVWMHRGWIHWCARMWRISVAIPPETLHSTAMKKCCRIASWEFNISPTSRHFWVDDFPFPQVGYVSSLEGFAFHIATLPPGCTGRTESLFAPKPSKVERVRVIVIGCDCKSVGEPCFEIFRLFGIMTHLDGWIRVPPKQTLKIWNTTQSFFTFVSLKVNSMPFFPLHHRIFRHHPSSLICFSDFQSHTSIKSSIKTKTIKNKSKVVLMTHDHTRYMHYLMIYDTYTTKYDYTATIPWDSQVSDLAPLFSYGKESWKTFTLTLW